MPRIATSERRRPLMLFRMGGYDVLSTWIADVAKTGMKGLWRSYVTSLARGPTGHRNGSGKFASVGARIGRVINSAPGFQLSVCSSMRCIRVTSAAYRGSLEMVMWLACGRRWRGRVRATCAVPACV